MSATKPWFSHAEIQSYATIASTLVAAFALVYSAISFQTTVHSSNRDQARRDWSELLKMISENGDMNFEYRVIDASVGRESGVDERRRGYDAYLNRMYFYMNSVIESDGIDNWKSQIEVELANHGALQCDEYMPETV